MGALRRRLAKQQQQVAVPWGCAHLAEHWLCPLALALTLQMGRENPAGPLFCTHIARGSPLDDTVTQLFQPYR